MGNTPPIKARAACKHFIEITNTQTNEVYLLNTSKIVQVCIAQAHRHTCYSIKCDPPPAPHFSLTPPQVTKTVDMVRITVVNGNQETGGLTYGVCPSFNHHHPPLLCSSIFTPHPTPTPAADPQGLLQPALGRHCRGARTPFSAVWRALILVFSFLWLTVHCTHLDRIHCLYNSLSLVLLTTSFLPPKLNQPINQPTPVTTSCWVFLE